MNRELENKINRNECPSVEIKTNKEFQNYKEIFQTTVMEGICFALQKQRVREKRKLLLRFDFKNIAEKTNGKVARCCVDANKTETEIDIIINAKTFVERYEKNKITCLGTIVHEVIHAFDYHNIACVNNLDNYEMIMTTCQFYYWTELHARSIGYEATIAKALKCVSTIREKEMFLTETRDIVIKEINALYESYKKRREANDDFLYDLSQILGIIRYFENSGLSKPIVEPILSQQLMNDKWIAKYYKVLTGIKSYNISLYDLDEIVDVLKEKYSNFTIYKNDGTEERQI